MSGQIMRNPNQGLTLRGCACFLHATDPVKARNNLYFTFEKQCNALNDNTY